jgi:hypothetical protein
MTAELEELLVAAKDINRQLPWPRLNIAIRAFEAAQPVAPDPDPYDFENDGLRKEP